MKKCPPDTFSLSALADGARLLAYARPHFIRTILTDVISVSLRFRTLLPRTSLPS
ncbi:MAG: hypothetical protein IJC30_03560 [Alphaproteobacteria bacterium]|nr:hypothetical protein [Alphaproteobacteria bacterium]